MKTTKLFGVLILVAGLALGTQSCKTVKTPALTQLSGTWNLKTLNGEASQVLFEGPQPTVVFDATQNHLSGNAGCNQYNGGFTYDKGELSAPNLASTMMMCAHANKEYEFLQALSAPSQISVNKAGELVFTKDGQNTLVFVKSKDISKDDLVGVWNLHSIDGGEVSELFDANKLPTVEFKMNEGRLVGNGGCNRYNGQYSIVGDVIKVGPLMSTRMACPSINGEAKLLQALEGEAKLEVEGRTLSFIKDGKAVLVFKQ